MLGIIGSIGDGVDAGDGTAGAGTDDGDDAEAGIDGEKLELTGGLGGLPDPGHLAVIGP